MKTLRDLLAVLPNATSTVDSTARRRAVRGFSQQHEPRVADQTQQLIEVLGRAG